VTTVARSAAQRYVAMVNARDEAGLAALFADDAILDHTLGRYEGRQAILGFYRDVIFAAGPVITATSWSEQGHTCVVSLEGIVGRHVTNTVEVFTVDGAGQITRLDITV
jgi:SnoaL-like domain